MVLKILIAATAAGSIIGKGGSTMNEFQETSGARIQLSRNGETFPGTTDRGCAACWAEAWQTSSARCT